jgi:hypothetical protein
MLSEVLQRNAKNEAMLSNISEFCSKALVKDKPEILRFARNDKRLFRES